MSLAPGATIGVLGGGQLCRMMAIEAKKMGFHLATLDPNPEGPAGQLADITIEGKWNDLEAAKKLAELSDVITLDTEHVAAKNLDEINKSVPVRPSPEVLRIIQDRLTQREFLKREGLPQTPFASLSQEKDIETVTASLGENCVLKVRQSGYDGKGQARANDQRSVDQAWREVGQNPCVAEAFIEFEKEISLLLARDINGQTQAYPIAENLHRHHVLHKTVVPAEVSEKIQKNAHKIGAQLAEAMDYVGLLAIEFFVTKNDELLINEIAPRPHNSGHFTFGACATSQFEQHIRAVAGLPLGKPDLHSPAVMLNLFGDLWTDRSPDWSTVFQYPEAHLHLYGKDQARPGRKMGHILILSEDKKRALSIAEAIEQKLSS